MNTRPLQLTSVVLALSALAAGRPFTGHFTLIRPDGQTISQNYIDAPGTPGHFQNKQKNSPTYFIKLAPSPYTFVPGLGYVSNPPVKNPFFSVNFPSNGKPNGLYSLSELRGTTTTPTPISRADSPVSWLQGRYMFNGRPRDGVTAVRAPASSSLLNALLARNANRSPSRFSSRRGKIDLSLW
ncbi:uncharacterized protein LOC119113949 [Pollicipes pollicipes]|uniref:uncharacterized protein LOC119113949 n=1 Tax=Pollicipes pollicipes TaxID=41117 RepID=UPI001884FA67|nr:uncharacterized protein LOC119113949 [Pollicipes pollicipes]